MPQTLHRLGFIGAGQMATALAKGVVSAGIMNADCVAAADPSPQAAESFALATGGRLLATNRAVVQDSGVVILATKPQHAQSALESVRAAGNSSKLLISIVAGWPLAKIAAALDGGWRLVRVMPNTPCLIGAGASAFCRDASASDEDAKLVQQLLSAVGIVHEVPEALLDAVTGLSGSGPAFVYTMIEALADGGVRMGLPRHVAASLAAQTVAGAARMVLETGEHPGVLRDHVASPGGTTIRGLQALEDRGLRGAVMAAVQAATERSAELGASS